MTALRIDRATGALSAAWCADSAADAADPHGDRYSVANTSWWRSTIPSALRVYRINADATPGDEVVQRGPIDPGIFAHQVRATPDNRQVILVAAAMTRQTASRRSPAR